jgi:hypothetical protein
MNITFKFCLQASEFADAKALIAEIVKIRKELKKEHPDVVVNIEVAVR